MKLTGITRSPSSIIALVCIPIFLGALDLTVVSAVLPHVVYDLEIPLQSGMDTAAWVVSGYLLAYSVAMTFMGTLSDRIGRQRVYLVALVIFAVGSYLVAVADGWFYRLAMRIAFILAGARPDPSQLALWLLIAARMVQAFGGGAMVPVGMAIAGDLYPPSSRARALGVIAAIDTAGWVVGHLYGGILTKFFNWRMIFWLNLPVCVIAYGLIAVALRGLPRPVARTGKMDWLGTALIAGTLVCLNLGLGSGSEGVGSVIPVQGTGWLGLKEGYLLTAGMLFILFLLREKKAAQPLVPLELFTRPNFLPASISNFLIGVSLFIAIASVPLYINTLRAETLNQAAWESGWMLSGLTVPMALASLPGGWLTTRLGYRLPALAGLALSIGGFLLMSRWDEATPYASMTWQLSFTGVGFGLTMAPIAAAILNTTPVSQRGTASGLVIIFRLVGMTVGTSAMATYGMQRANYLSKLLVGINSDAGSLALAATQIATKVINETFLIAAGICFLALIPTGIIMTYMGHEGGN